MSSLRINELIAIRAQELGDEPAIVTGRSTVSYGELVDSAKIAATSIAAIVPRNGALLLGDDPLIRVIGLLAAMEARRVVHLGSGRIGPASVPRGCTHRFDGNGLVEISAAGSPWIESIGGFAFVVETSGTTGMPKFVVHDERSLAANLVLTTSAEDEMHGEITPDPWKAGGAVSRLAGRSPHGLSFLSGMPLTSIAGVSMLFRAIAMGERFVIAETLEPLDIWETAIRLGVTNVGLPPFTAGRFASLAVGESSDRPRLLHLGIGGAFADPELVDRLEQSLGCLVTVGYGATELGGVAIMSRPWDPVEIRRGTIGRPLNGVDVRLREVDGNGSELLVRSPSMARGVVDGDVVHELGEWFATGDLVELTPDGEFVIAGRADFMITRGGHRIDPARIEAVIERHPTVERCGVIGVSSRISGNHDIVAYVSFSSPPVDEIGAEEARFAIRHHCVKELQTYEVPRRIRTVVNIPLASDRSPDRAGLLRLADPGRTGRNSKL